VELSRADGSLFRELDVEDVLLKRVRWVSRSEPKKFILNEAAAESAAVRE
jgi:hypothetical protein